MVYRRKLRTVRKRRAVRKRAPARRRLQSKLNYGDFRDVARSAAIAMGAKAVHSKFVSRKGRNIPVSRRKGVIEPLGDEGTGGYSQWTQRYQQGKFGRLTPRKIDKLSIDKVIFTHRRLGPFNDNGQWFMKNYLDATNNLTLPLVLMELNSVNNNVAGTITTSQPVWELGQLAGSTSMFWTAMSGQATDGTTLASQWQLERSPQTTSVAASYPGESAIHLWSSVDLELWGCKNKPTKYDIMLCQFSEDVLPSYATVSDPNAVNFWQSIVKQYSYSPLAKMESGFNYKKMRIMKHYKVNIDPTASYELDSDPHVKTLKLFYRFNRNCNFQWKYSGVAGQTISNMNDADWNQQDADNQTQVHPNARIYLMIRASNYTRLVSPAAIDNTTNPSISWRIRSAYMINQ